MPLLIAFIAVPILEIFLFLQVGSLIGVWWTIGIVILTAVFGTLLVRSQGALVMNDIRSSVNEIRDPTEPLAHGAMILVAGVLLLTPGFFTDTLGFALLLPPVRQRAYAALRQRINIVNLSGAGATKSQPRRDDDVIDGEYKVVEPDPDAPPGTSGWTRH